jgi:hypothetical protein
MITKIKHIFEGWYNRFRGINYELMIQRMKHCQQCPEILYLTKKEPICGICGCPLKSKCSVKDERCPNGL